jgi:hypothetical protein
MWAVHKSAVFIEARRGWQILGAGVTGSCDQPNMDAGNQNEFLCKRSACCYLTSHGGLELYRETGWVNHGEQVSKQHSSMTCCCFLRAWLQIPKTTAILFRRKFLRLTGFSITYCTKAKQNRARQDSQSWQLPEAEWTLTTQLKMSESITEIPK